MIIDYFGIQLEVIDNGDGTFSIRPVDAEADRPAIRAELQRLRAERGTLNETLDGVNAERDYHIERRDYFVGERAAIIAERNAINTRIDELVAFLESAGETDL